MLRNIRFPFHHAEMNRVVAVLGNLDLLCFNPGPAWCVVKPELFIEHLDDTPEIIQFLMGTLEVVVRLPRHAFGGAELGGL